MQQALVNIDGTLNLAFFAEKVAEGQICLHRVSFPTYGFAELNQRQIRLIQD
jgi:hypothetical protein